MGKLPSEVVEEIVSCLPIKSLARFRCLSKSWNSLFLNNREFSKLRFDKAPQQPRIGAQKVLISACESLHCVDCESLASYNAGNQTEVDFPSKKPGFSVNFVGSCNGLVCCVATDRLEGIFLWNPSTGIYRKLPNPDIQNQPCLYGFGYDSASNDYKIVIMNLIYRKITYDFSKKVPITQVFSLKANSWKRPNSADLFLSISEEYWMPKEKTGLLFKEALHWIDHKGFGVYAFDLKSETFYTILVPDIYMYYSSADLVVFNGCLGLARQDKAAFITEFLIMEEYRADKSWVRRLDRFTNFQRSYVLGVHYISLQSLCVEEKGAFKALANSSRILMSDSKDGTSQTVGLCEHGHSFQAISYEEDLSSPYLCMEGNDY